VSAHFEYLTSAERTDVGRRRKNNEDALLRLPEHGVFCVADGMGGVQGGEVASAAVVREIRQEFDTGPDAAFAVTAAAKARLVERAVNRASAWIKSRADERGMVGTGSTAVTLMFDAVYPERAVAAHAGDSRAYRFRRAKLTQLTVDHSVAAAAGLRDDRALPAMFRGVVTRAAGIAASVTMERTATDAAAGDLFLLCSDGLSRMVPDRQILKLLRRHERAPLDELAGRLVDEAVRAGGEDNVSVVLVRVGAALPAGPTMSVPPETLAIEAPAAAASAGGPKTGGDGGEAETGETRDPAAGAAGPATPPSSDSGGLAGETPDTPPSDGSAAARPSDGRFARWFRREQK
jgi:protein phosphatase